MSWDIPAFVYRLINDDTSILSKFVIMFLKSVFVYAKVVE